MNTAAAAISFVFLAKGWYSGETKSTRYSMAVFNASVIQTKAMATTSINQLKTEIWKKNPAASTATVANKCSQVLCSVLNNILMPLKAYPKLLNRFLIENDSWFLCIKSMIIGMKKTSYFSFKTNFLSPESLKMPGTGLLFLSSNCSVILLSPIGKPSIM